jgi:hypothetical protein
VLEIATRVELSRLGVLPEHAHLVWRHVQDGMVHHHTLLAGSAMPEMAAILCVEPQTGQIVVRLFDEAADEDAANGSHLDQPGAPLVFVIFRLSRFIQRTATRIQHVQHYRAEAGQ